MKLAVFFVLLGSFALWTALQAAPAERQDGRSPAAAPLHQEPPLANGTGVLGPSYPSLAEGIPGAASPAPGHTDTENDYSDANEYGMGDGEVSDDSDDYSDDSDDSDDFSDDDSYGIWWF
ncbi:surface protein-like [Alligator mississippiensis]|uniref:Surface protein-like n=1 Tax=Alligator mississippiensis TaxID=8496 RepID=A0A151N641_ALLMI|nr:surface protein-like [Alligator mississippiensis]